MRYASPITRTAVQAITVVCAVVFVIFSIIYLHFYQAEFLGLEQEVLSRGQTVYYPQWGTPLITLLLLGLGLLIRALVSFPIRVQALAWFPSAYLLGVLTCMRFQVGTNEVSHIPWGWIVVMAVFYVLALILCRMYPDVRSENETMSTYMFPNMLILFFSFLFTCMIGNSSSSLHFELRAQRMIAEEDYEGVLRVGERSQSFTPRLTAMRAYAMSRRHKLGDSLFFYPLHVGSQDLLPECPDTLIRGDVPSEIYEYLGARPGSRFSEPHVTHFLEHVYEHDSIPTPQVAQYLLCSYLLDKNLDKFSDFIVQIYDSMTTSLPRHYQEAIVLNAYLQDPQDSTYQTWPIYDEFAQFGNQKSQYASQGISSARNSCLEVFSHTYWFYYYFNE